MIFFPQEGFLASAQQYAQITELSQRVTEWEEKILPKLQEEVRITQQLYMGELDTPSYSPSSTIYIRMY